MAWEAIFPEPFMDGRHIKALCDHMQALAEGLFDGLIVNIPPGHTKSRTMSILFPAWMYGPRRNRDQWLHASVKSGLAERDSEDTRKVMRHPWYQARWPHVKFSTTADKKTEWELTEGGKRTVTSPTSKATGLRGRWRMADDLHDLNESEAQCEATIEWVKNTWFSRKNFGQERPIEAVIMQRTGENDYTGFLLENYKKKYVHLCLPLEYDPERHCVTPIFEDWRKEEGEPLWPEAYARMVDSGDPYEWIEQEKRAVGPKNWDCQQNQKPHPAGGKEFDAAWLNNTFLRLVASTVDRWIVSIDCTFKDGPNTDFVSMMLIAKIGPYYYLVDEIAERMSWLDTKRNAADFVAKWRDRGLPILTCVIEKAANGHALCEEMKKYVSGAVGWDPLCGKTERVRATTGIWAAGQVLYPEEGAELVIDIVKGDPVVIKLNRHWVSENRYQHKSFPKPSVHDDSVDAVSQGILYCEDFRNQPRGIPNVGLAA